MRRNLCFDLASLCNFLRAGIETVSKSHYYDAIVSGLPDQPFRTSEKVTLHASSS